MFLSKLFNLALLLALAAGAAEEDECSNLSSPQCCFDAWKDWTASKSSYEESTQTVVDYTDIYVQETYTGVPTTTLCDGFLRYLGRRTGEISKTRIPADEPVTTWVAASYPTPQPDCTIKEEDCTPFIEDFISSSKAYERNNSMPYYTHPPCTTYQTCPGAEDSHMCKMLAEASTLWYWPVTVEGDLCSDRTTITPAEPTRSTVISDTTFISPSVYISVEGVEAHDFANRLTHTGCGRDMHDIMLTLDPADVSTRYGRADKRHSTFRQLNLADLNDPVPVTAYFGLEEAPDCGAVPENCTESMQEGHTPVLAVPMQKLQDLDPDFEFCDLHPSYHGEIGPVTWIPLEPTQDGWPEATGEPGEYEDGEGDGEDKNGGESSGDEPAVTHVISTTQTLQDPTGLRV